MRTLATAVHGNKEAASNHLPGTALRPSALYEPVESERVRMQPAAGRRSTVHRPWQAGGRALSSAASKILAFALCALDTRADSPK
jgi:hypothetical protein